MLGDAGLASTTLRPKAKNSPLPMPNLVSTTLDLDKVILELGTTLAPIATASSPIFADAFFIGLDTV